MHKISSKSKLKEGQEVPQIYFSSNPQREINSTNNDGFDDKEGKYIHILNDHINYRYEALEILGEGSFGRVIKAFDHKTKNNVAIKIIHNCENYIRHSAEEIRLVSYLNGKEQELKSKFHIVQLIEHFNFHSHPCLVFELLGENLYDHVKRVGREGISSLNHKKIAYQIFSCLNVLQNEKIIHCDIKPENILLANGESYDVKLVDFGSGSFIHNRIHTYLQSRYYRSPEIILGIRYSTQIDVWSLGCILPELLMNFPLFPGESEIDQLQCMMEVLDVPPKSLLDISKRQKEFFDSRGLPIGRVTKKGKKRIPNSKTVSSIMKIDVDSYFLDLIHCCLKWDAEIRIRPNAALKHPWFDEYVLNIPISN